jgi:hypothetical protein
MKPIGMFTRLLATALACASLVLGSPAYAAQDIPAGGAFSCDFQVRGDTPLNSIPPMLERDRMYMADRPGMLRKDVPLSFNPDPASPNLFGGGRYLFDSFEHAQDYQDFVEEQFVLDGVQFLKRPYFISPDCHAWVSIGARDFSDIHTSHVVVRTERYTVRSQHLSGFLRSRWPRLAAAAEARGLSSVYLWYDRQQRLVSVVSFANRVGPQNPLAPDFASLGALAAPVGVGQHVFGDQAWPVAMDRTQWVLSIWFPFVLGDHGEPSQWPNSPVFPQPYAGDGVCEVSRGENAQNSPGDCLPTCWNGIQDPGETSANCPGDVRLFPKDD